MCRYLKKFCCVGKNPWPYASAFLTQRRAGAELRYGAQSTPHRHAYTRKTSDVHRTARTYPRSDFEEAKPFSPDISHVFRSADFQVRCLPAACLHAIHKRPHGLAQAGVPSHWAGQTREAPSAEVLCAKHPEAAPIWNSACLPRQPRRRQATQQVCAAMRDVPQ